MNFIWTGYLLHSFGNLYSFKANEVIILIILGVSGEKVEIDPVGSKGAKFFKQKAMTFDADNIASCEILEEKASGNYGYWLSY